MGEKKREDRGTEREVDQVSRQTVCHLLNRRARMLGLFHSFNDLAEGGFFSEPVSTHLKTACLVDGARDLSYGGKSWGNFVEIDGLNTGRFLAGRELQDLDSSSGADDLFTDRDSREAYLTVTAHTPYRPEPPHSTRVDARKHGNASVCAVARCIRLALLTLTPQQPPVTLQQPAGGDVSCLLPPL